MESKYLDISILYLHTKLLSFMSYQSVCKTVVLIAIYIDKICIIMLIILYIIKCVCGLMRAHVCIRMCKFIDVCKVILHLWSMNKLKIQLFWFIGY